VLDFTSSLYLGMTHPSAALEPWSSLTTGAPAVLREAPSTRAVERGLAALQGCERASLAVSTLHVVWDLFAIFAGADTLVCVEERTYPVANWGVERAHGRGARVATFAHHDPEDLARALRASDRARVLVVADGFCRSCGRFPPLASYLAAARGRGGLLVLDDTLALGVFGTPASGAPYGVGGGGALRHLGVDGPDVLVVASLAKAFGAPVAALSGGREAVALFDRRSATRVHSSPPSTAAIHAAAHALADNFRCGDDLRRRLAANVRRFKEYLRSGGVMAEAGGSPVVRVQVSLRAQAKALQSALGRRGVRCFVQARCQGGVQLGFVVRADHEARHVDQAAFALLSALDGGVPFRDISWEQAC
jgi:8-amino-7-oxononanoate synthase